MPRLFRALSLTLVALIFTGLVPAPVFAAGQDDWTGQDILAGQIAWTGPEALAGQDAWSNAHSYMTAELKEAQSAGLIPGVMDGADFALPITRVEFAHLIILLCETFTGVSSEPSSKNPFTDTDDLCAFKAYGFGIMEGTDGKNAGGQGTAGQGTGGQGTNGQGTDGQGTAGQGALFSPDSALDRETMAFMFYRAIRVVAPLADYSVTNKPDIPDAAAISQWAGPSVSYLYSRGIIIGANNSKFMPRPMTAAQAGSNYGMATREQCVVIAKRVYLALPGICGSRFRIEDKAAEVLAYAKDEPQGGEEIARDELADILRPFAAKARWADNMIATSYLGDYQKTGDGQWRHGYDSAFLYNAFSAKGRSQYKFDEEQTLLGVGAGRSRFALNVFDAELNTMSTYLWDSENEAGAQYGAPAASASFFSPLSLTSYMPGRLNWTYKLYDDDMVGGELCKVFSVTWVEDTIQWDEPPGEPPGLAGRGVPPSAMPPEIPPVPEGDSVPGDGQSGLASRDAPPSAMPPTEREVTDYYYISTVSGLCVVQKNYATLRETTYQSIMIVFNISPSFTDASEIAPPPDIEFIPS